MTRNWGTRHTQLVPAPLALSLGRRTGRRTGKQTNVRSHYCVESGKTGLYASYCRTRALKQDCKASLPITSYAEKQNCQFKKRYIENKRRTFGGERHNQMQRWTCVEHPGQIQMNHRYHWCRQPAVTQLTDSDRTHALGKKQLALLLSSDRSGETRPKRPYTGAPPNLGLGTTGRCPARCGDRCLHQVSGVNQRMSNPISEHGRSVSASC